MISTFLGVPMQPSAVGVIVYRTTPSDVPVFTNIWLIIFPQFDEHPENPVIVPPAGIVRIPAVQLNVVPGKLLIIKITGVTLEQTDPDSGVTVTVGIGLGFTVKVAIEVIDKHVLLLNTILNSYPFCERVTGNVNVTSQLGATTFTGAR
jgi:hypothetical protein